MQPTEHHITFEKIVYLLQNTFWNIRSHLLCQSPPMTDHHKTCVCICIYFWSTHHPVTVTNKGLDGFPTTNGIIRVVTVTGWGGSSNKYSWMTNQAIITPALGLILCYCSKIGWFGIRIPKQVTRNHRYYWNYDIHILFTHHIQHNSTKNIHGDPCHILHTFVIFLQISRQSASYFFYHVICPKKTATPLEQHSADGLRKR